MSLSLQDVLNQANPNTLPDGFRLTRIGDALRSIPTSLYNQVPALAPGEQPATLQVVKLPNGGKATDIVFAYARGATAPGPLTVAAYPPAAGEIAVAPNGDICVLTADAITNLDFQYIPAKAEEWELEAPVAANVLTIPAVLVARGVLLAVEVEATVATSGGFKRVMPPATVVAAGQCALNDAKDEIAFFAADAVTSARVILLLAPTVDISAQLSADSPILLPIGNTDKELKCLQRMQRHLASNRQRQPSTLASLPSLLVINPLPLPQSLNPTIRSSYRRPHSRKGYNGKVRQP